MQDYHDGLYLCEVGYTELNRDSQKILNMKSYSWKVIAI